MITAENQARSAETRSHDEDEGMKGREADQSNWTDKRKGQGYIRTNGIDSLLKIRLECGLKC